MYVQKIEYLFQDQRSWLVDVLIVYIVLFNFFKISDSQLGSYCFFFLEEEIEKLEKVMCYYVCLYFNYL